MGRATRSGARPTRCVESAFPLNHTMNATITLPRGPRTAARCSTHPTTTTTPSFNGIGLNPLPCQDMSQINFPARLAGPTSDRPLGLESLERYREVVVSHILSFYSSPPTLPS